VRRGSVADLVRFAEPQVSPPRVRSARLAYQIDRLSRSAHAFHRFAHHPLCVRYSGEVFRLGRKTRVCRGCSLVLLGATLGVVSGASLGSLPAALASTGLAIGFATLPGVRFGASRALAPAVRTSKVLTRFVPGLGLAFAVASAARHPSVASAAGAVIGALCAAALLVAYRRRGPNRSPCLQCPEYRGPRTCSGFCEIVSRERALMRKAGAMIRAGCGSPRNPMEIKRIQAIGGGPSSLP
jgi:hypothetical protein